MSVLAAFAVPHPPLILPAIGNGEEKRIQRTIDAYRETAARIAALAPDTVVIVSPHATLYADYFHISPGAGARGDFEKFHQPELRAHTEYDEDFADALAALSKARDVPAGTLGEKSRSLDHATMIPLLFLQEAYKDFRAVRIGLSGLSPLVHYRLGKCIAETAERMARRTVLLASGDLSHRLLSDGPYGFAKEGPTFDRAVTEAFAAGDFLSLLTLSPELADAAGECGLRAFQIMAGALDGKAVSHELLSYEGPFGVGYGVAAFLVQGDDPARRFDALYEKQQNDALAERRAGEDAFVRLARLSLETHVQTGRPLDALAPDLPDELTKKRAGAFVSLKLHGRLRGCIGTVSPTTDSLASEIVRNAVSAGTEDPRFSPVTADELAELVYSVDVLGTPEPVDSPAALDPARYGVIVERGGRRGLLLPNLDGVDTVEAQLAIAKSKAGIAETETVRLSRFEVVRHH